MSNNFHNPADKFDTHYCQQLSSLMDGELSLDEARFLLRRLQHDEELSGRFERWQLCGDVLRGQACAPAPIGFSQRVALALAAVPASAEAAPARRGSWARWGGGAALAASVAAMALFVARQQVPEDGAVPSAPLVATSPAEIPQNDFSDVTAAVPIAAKASNARRQEGMRRSTGATRNQQVARTATRKGNEPVRAVASGRASPAGADTALPVAPGNPFAAAAGHASSRPWPRSALPQATGAGSAFNASFQTENSARATFYPFEPRLQHPVPLPQASDLVTPLP